MKNFLECLQRVARRVVGLSHLGHEVRRIR